MGKLLSILGSCKSTYLAWMIGKKETIFEDEDELEEDVVDDELEVNEFVGEDGGVKVAGGGKEGGGSLKVLKGVLITNFWTFVST